jgi:hypothetical protein
MPSLGKIEVRNDAPSLPSGDKNPSYVSPDGSLKLEFYDCLEFHNGASAWKLRLLHRHADVSREHDSLGSDQWRCPEHYQPWLGKPPQLLLAHWKPAAFLYDLESKKKKECNFSGHILGAAASKTLPRIVVQGIPEISLLDAEGRMVAALPQNAGQPERPVLAWFDKAGCLFRVGRENQASPTKIHFYEANAGTAVGEIALDPKTLLPYQASEYASIPRNPYSLILSRSRRSVGHFLDIWTRVHFDDSRSVLQLQTYRPTSEPFVEGHATVCEVDPRWIEVELLP